MSEVFKSLVSAVPAPKAFKIIEDEDHSHSDGEDIDASKVAADADKGKNKSSSLKKSKAKAKAKPKCAKAKPSASEAILNKLGSSYKPNEYKAEYKKYYKQRREDGLSHLEALADWNNSDVKKRLIEGMSVAEQKRRRFLKE